jgi:hypothetical protein
LVRFQPSLKRKKTLLAIAVKYFKRIVGIKKAASSCEAAFFYADFIKKSLGQGENSFKTQAG